MLSHLLTRIRPGLVLFPNYWFGSNPIGLGHRSLLTNILELEITPFLTKSWHTADDV